MFVPADAGGSAFQSFVPAAQRVGFLRGAPDLGKLVEAP
jgi:NitT/TauT family transport system substrate-binding protein